VEVGSFDPLIETTYVQQPMLRAPEVAAEPAVESAPVALITVKVWHLLVLTAVFVATVGHFELGLY